MIRRRLSPARAPFWAVISPRGAVASTPGRRAILIAVVGLLSASVPVAGAGATGDRASATRVVTVYSVATGLQYINSADDSARGKVNNPFDRATNQLAPKGSGSGDGPVAGDIAVYSLDLYSDSTLKRHAGSGVYTCYFNYHQHALCQAYYKTRSAGTLVASGPVDFNTSGFTIVITGGTKTYLGARGEVNVGASKKKSTQRVDFELIQ